MADEQAEGHGATGRALVRERLVTRLTEAGVQRPKAMRVSDLDALWRRLVEDLAYMSPDNLDTLADQLLDIVAQDRQVRLPAEIVIRQMARALQAKPLVEARIVTSWFRSVEGPIALAGGYGVELLRFLQSQGKPPGPYDMRKIRERAAANDRQRQVIAQNAAVNRATPDELAWAEAYARDAARVHDIVASRVSEDAA